MPVIDFAPYRKTVLAVVGAALAWWQQVISSPSNPITAGEWRTLAVLVAMAAGVYGVTNKAE